MRVLIKFCSVAVIAFLATSIGPAKWQPPRTGLVRQIDHFLGYFVATSIRLARLARRPFVVGGLLMVVAVLLEALQASTPDRHADSYAALFGAGGAPDGGFAC